MLHFQTNFQYKIGLGVCSEADFSIIQILFASRNNHTDNPSELCNEKNICLQGLLCQIHANTW